MNKICTIIFALFLQLCFYSQTLNNTNPIGWKGKLDTKTIPIKTMKGYNQSLIDSEDAINDISKEKPWRFGYKYNVNYTVQNSGNWTILPNGDNLWQLAIECQNALTVNLLFENYNLPEGARLYLYDENQTNKVGAYTNINNRTDGQLGTELVHGEKIIVEYFEPADVKYQGTFTISNVIHGYRSLDPIQNSLSKALNSSGDCNIDVNCPLGNGWENEINSVAMIVVNGSGICTGALINNTCNDGTPYFLTANHCLGGGTGSWAFRFNWQSPPGTESCATTANSVDPGPPYDQTANGATTLVSSAGSDFALLEIDNMTLTDAQNWNCFYAGWDATDASTVTETIGIHHPSGDVKKICKDNDAPYHSSAGGAAVWYIDEWEEGVTEPGSSGSPLFDQNHRIIGQLYGGAAACSGTVNNAQYDYYGRIGVSWNNGLDGYLAPNSCGFATVNDGWDPNTPTLPDDAGISGITSPGGAYCIDNFDPEITLRNYGTNNLTFVTINYDLDGGVNNIFNWTGNLAPGASETIVFANMTTTAGPHTFNAYTTLPNGNSDSNPLNDGTSSNYSATIGGQDIQVEINTDCWGSEVTWTIEDVNSNVLASGGPYADVIGGELITTTVCLAIDCYDFIINDSYGDGMYGSQWNSCSVDGDYTIIDVASGTVLASTIAANSDYGNQEINNFCVSLPCSWSLSSNTTEETCYGDSTGSITVNINGGAGPFTFDIGNGPQNTGTFNNLTQGSYSISVSDSICTSLIPVILSGPNEISGTITTTDVSCNGLSDGTLTVIGSGGDSTYTYDFGSGFVSNNSLNGLSAGSQTVIIQDGNGCIGTVYGTVNQPGAINVTTYVVDETFGSDGVINITVSGGVSPFTYLWTGPSGYTSTNEDIGGLVSGSYTLIVTDANGCSTTINDILVDSFIGIFEDGETMFSIYPNPSKGIFNISFNEKLNNPINVSVFDLTGRLILSYNLKDKQETKIDISTNSYGTYILKIEIGEKQYLKRISNIK
ncbi:MAG: hypothetical protein CL846_02235 [Crocinitomicaceae bacterium]|nr:hypothetical protein [Crocinitomicaceae bacterium]|tara:strand:- start:585 stop:3584 length:3000 start_codon:yes stop_codon:yes gene_type:complete